MKPTVLLFNIEGKKLAAIRLCAVKLGIRPVTVSRKSFGSSLEQLLADEPTEPKEAEIDGEMLLMCGFARGMLDAFLYEIRKKGAAVTMKAVLTETNKMWSADRLYAEISAEHAAFQKGRAAH